MIHEHPSAEAAGYPPGGGPPGGYPPPPGGGYGPPGGPPGGGYPPSGGPPGGFGGPPGPPGGFGGPPGGFGGPPGSGFGGPGGPPGGFGPPGGPGFGGPPGGFGGPPMGGMPPKKSGSNLGLIIGLGCGALVLVGVVLAVIAAVVSSGSDAPTASQDDSVQDAPPPPPPPPAAEGKLELQDVRFYDGPGSSKVVYVVGELVNVGSVPINAPRAKITVYDNSKTALDDTICGAFIVRDLQPNEKVPCYAVMSKASGYKTFKVEPEFSKTFVTYRAADLKISDVESTSPRSAFGAHKVTGKITNNSSFTAKGVWVVVGLYDENGKIVGAGRTVVAGNDLDPGASGKFTVSIFNVAATPKKSLTKVFGYDK